MVLSESKYGLAVETQDASGDTSWATTSNVRSSPNGTVTTASFVRFIGTWTNDTSNIMTVPLDTPILTNATVLGNIIISFRSKVSSTLPTYTYYLRYKYSGTWCSTWHSSVSINTSLIDRTFTCTHHSETVAGLQGGGLEMQFYVVASGSPADATYIFSVDSVQINIGYYTLPSVPLSVSASADSSSQISVTWSAPSDLGGGTISDYDVYWEISGGGGSGNASSGAGDTAHTITGLNTGTIYDVWVTATTEGGTSGNSTSDSAETYPDVPTNLALSSWDNDSFTITFTEPNEGGGAAHIYRISYGTDASATNITNGSTSSSPDTRTVGLSDKEGKKIYFKIRAEGAEGNSAYTAPEWVYLHPEPGVIATVTPTVDGFFCNWSPPTYDGTIVSYRLDWVSDSLLVVGATNATITGLSPNTQYAVKVRVESATWTDYDSVPRNDTSAYGGVTTKYTLATELSAGDFRVAPLREEGFFLKWVSTGGSATNWKVEEYTGSWATLATLGGTVFSYEVTGKNKSTEYQYGLSASNGDGVYNTRHVVS